MIWPGGEILVPKVASVQVDLPPQSRVYAAEGPSVLGWRPSSMLGLLLEALKGSCRGMFLRDPSAAAW